MISGGMPYHRSSRENADKIDFDLLPLFCRSHLLADLKREGNEGGSLEYGNENWDFYIRASFQISSSKQNESNIHIMKINSILAGNPIQGYDNTNSQYDLLFDYLNNLHVSKLLSSYSKHKDSQTASNKLLLYQLNELQKVEPTRNHSTLLDVLNSMRANKQNSMDYLFNVELNIVYMYTVLYLENDINAFLKLFKETVAYMHEFISSEQLHEMLGIYIRKQNSLSKHPPEESASEQLLEIQIDFLKCQYSKSLFLCGAVLFRMLHQRIATWFNENPDIIRDEPLVRAIWEFSAEFDNIILGFFRVLHRLSPRPDYCLYPLGFCLCLDSILEGVSSYASGLDTNEYSNLINSIDGVLPDLANEIRLKLMNHQGNEVKEIQGGVFSIDSAIERTGSDLSQEDREKIEKISSLLSTNVVSSREDICRIILRLCIQYQSQNKYIEAENILYCISHKGILSDDQILIISNPKAFIQELELNNFEAYQIQGTQMDLETPLNSLRPVQSSKSTKFLSSDDFTFIAFLLVSKIQKCFFSYRDLTMSRSQDQIKVISLTLR